MFTGIVEELGTVGSLEVGDRHARLTVAATTVVGDASVGDSIAVNGCCLTITDFVVDEGGSARRTGFRADLMAETLRATGLGDLLPGAPVNLERAMRADTRLGGHLVQGHVDAVGEVVARQEQPGTVFLTIRSPASLAPYLVAKGSVTVDGTSLTVVDVSDRADDAVDLRIALIPHTLQVTTFGVRQVGDRVNIEADVIAKYVERMLAAGTTSPYTAPTTGA